MALPRRRSGVASSSSWLLLPFFCSQLVAGVRLDEDEEGLLVLMNGTGNASAGNDSAGNGSADNASRPEAEALNAAANHLYYADETLDAMKNGTDDSNGFNDFMNDSNVSLNVSEQRFGLEKDELQPGDHSEEDKQLPGQGFDFSWRRRRHEATMAAPLPAQIRLKDGVPQKLTPAEWRTAQKEEKTARDVQKEKADQNADAYADMMNNETVNLTANQSQIMAENTTDANFTGGPWDHIEQDQWDVMHVAAEAHHAATTPDKDACDCDPGSKPCLRPPPDVHSASYNVDVPRKRGDPPSAGG